MYKNYVFDLYGTLVYAKKNWDHPIIWEKMSQLYCFYGACYDTEEFKEKFGKYLEKLREYDENQHADFDIEDIFYQLFKKKNIKPKNKLVREAARVFLLFITEALEIKPNVGELIKQLKEADKDIYVFDNGQGTFAKNELRAVELYKYIDGVVMSSNIRLKKEDAKAWDLFLEGQGLNPEETLVISGKNIGGVCEAERKGLDTVYILDGQVSYDEEVKGTYTVHDKELLKILDL